MTDRPLNGKHIAIMVANGFEETEFTDPQKRLLQAGATVKVVSRANGLVNGWYENTWGHFFPVDGNLAETLAIDFDGLIVPGGMRSMEKLVEDAHAKRILAAFMRAETPVLVFNDAVRLLRVTDNLSGRALTGAEDCRAEAETAGGRWQESEVVHDGNLVTGIGGAATEAALEKFIALVEVYEREVTAAA